MNIIELAKEAGFEVDEGLFPFGATEDKFIGTERELERFAALVRAEREWVDLTDDELFVIANKVGFDGELMKINNDRGMPSIAELYVKAVIAKFKEKNT